MEGEGDDWRQTRVTTKTGGRVNPIVGRMPALPAPCAHATPRGSNSPSEDGYLPYVASFLVETASLRQEKARLGTSLGVCDRSLALEWSRVRRARARKANGPPVSRERQKIKHNTQEPVRGPQGDCVKRYSIARLPVATAGSQLLLRRGATGTG